MNKLVLPARARELMNIVMELKQKRIELFNECFNSNDEVSAEEIELILILMHEIDSERAKIADLELVLSKKN